MSPAILIVDDEPGLAATLAMVLEDEGFTVRTAIHGADALRLHALTPADLILSDVMMPVLTGLAMVDTLREHGDLTPVILMSAVARYGRQGASAAFLEKPFDLDTLIATVRSQLVARRR